MENASIKLVDDIPGVGARGETVQFALQPSDVHVTQEMTDFLGGYKPFEFRGTEAAKIAPVSNIQSTYRIFDAANAFLRVHVKGSVDGKAPEIDATSTTDNLTTNLRYVAGFVPKVTEEEAQWDVQQVTLERCARALDIDLEVDIWTMLTTTTNWSSSSYYASLGATYKWNEGTNSHPVKNLMARMEASMQPVTDIWMNGRVVNAFLQHNDVKDWIQLHVGDGAASKMLGELNAADGQQKDFTIPRLGRIHVVESKYTEAATTAPDYCLGNHVVLTATPPGIPTNGEAIATAYTYRRRGASGTGYDVRSVPVNERGFSGGNMVIVSVADIPVFTGKTCGGLIYNAYQ